MTGFRLAWRTAARYRVRAVLAMIGVAVIGALNFDMLLLSRGLLLSFADMINSADFDVRVVGGAGVPLMRLPVADATALASDIGRLAEIREVALLRFETAYASTPRHPGLGVTLVGSTTSGVADGWRLLRGVDLADAGPGAPPLIVTRRLASLLQVEPGSPLQLRVTTAVRGCYPSEHG